MQATTMNHLTRKTIEGLEELRDELRSELSVMSFTHPGREIRVTELARIVRKIRDLRGE
jgi:hypothetical protein